MKTNGWTAGPWKLAQSSTGFEISSDADTCWIAEVPNVPPYGEANAQLIAAAPELVEALQLLVNQAKEDAAALYAEKGITLLLLQPAIVTAESVLRKAGAL